MAAMVPFDWFTGWVERAEADDFLIWAYIAAEADDVSLNGHV